MNNILDDRVKKEEISTFIENDPVQFPHKFQDKRDIEISGLISSSLSYGKREKIIKIVEIVHELIEYKPYEFALNFDIKKDGKLFEKFIYRYNNGNDMALLIHSIGQALKEYNSLEEVFLKGYSSSDKNIKPALTSFVSILTDYLPIGESNLKLIPSPDKGSACKRLNMYLRWMVRSGPVDLGIWKEISTSKLIIPLDTHVAKLSRKLHLTERKADDWKTAEEITDKLKEFDAHDPVKYDFALFGMGISGNIDFRFD